MKIKSMLAAVAIASMATTPVLAAQTANPAASLSLSSGARASAPTGKTNKAAAGGVIAALIAAGVVAIVVIAATKGDNSNSSDNSDSN